MGYASLVNANAEEDRIPSRRRASLVIDPVIKINIDVLTEILLCLPVQSLLRFRAVSKSWGHIIDSPSFRTLHTRNNKSDDAVTLQVYTNFLQNILSIKLQHNGKSLMSYEAESLTDSSFKLVGAVMGLICINLNKFQVPISICNPSLGQLKLLPLRPTQASPTYHPFHFQILWNMLARGCNWFRRRLQSCATDVVPKTPPCPRPSLLKKDGIFEGVGQR